MMMDAFILSSVIHDDLVVYHIHFLSPCVAYLQNVLEKMFLPRLWRGKEVMPQPILMEVAA